MKNKNNPHRWLGQSLPTRSLKLLSNQCKAIFREHGLFIYSAWAKFGGFSIINDNETYQAM